MENKKELQYIEVSKIFVLNPRERNELIRKEIKKNIEDVGLKRPITVCRKKEPVDGYEYDLVCGQGRLEVYLENGEKTIPAVIVDVTQEDALIMSLVENIARRNYHPSELLQGIKSMRDKGYTPIEISEKTGLSKEYIVKIGILLDKGEGRLIDAVERQKVPLNVAMAIAQLDDAEVQNILQEAYETNTLRGRKLSYVKKLIETRKKSGKGLRHKGSRKISVSDLNQLFMKEIERKKLLISRAEKAEKALFILVQAFKTLYKNNNFKTLLRAEKLEQIPKCLVERIQEDGNVERCI